MAICDLKERTFNLLKPYVAPPSTWDKIYSWTLTRARVILIIAQVIVVATFLVKVVIDMQAKDLNEEIDRQEAALREFSMALEPELRQIQLKSKAYEKIWEGSSAYADVVNEIISYVPNLGQELNLRISGDSVTVRGSGSFADLSQIEAKMKQSKTFSSAKLANLEASSEVGAETGKYIINAIIANVENRSILE